MVLDSLTPIPPPLKVKDHHLDYLSVDNKSNDVHSDEQNNPCFPPPTIPQKNEDY